MSAATKPAGAAPRGTPDWHSIAWKKVLPTVRRLQARIVKALQEGRWGKVKALVYLLTHSFAGRAAAILRVVSHSGARTPGVDRQRWNTPEAKAAAFHTLTRRGYRSQPLRRVYILNVPMDRSILRQWLKAGYLEKNVFFATTEGTPQGGIASAALANRTLDGLQALLAERFGVTRRQRERNRVHLVRYADDFLITGTSKVLLTYEVQPLVVQ